VVEVVVVVVGASVVVEVVVEVVVGASVVVEVVVEVVVGASVVVEVVVVVVGVAVVVLVVVVVVAGKQAAQSKSAVQVVTLTHGCIVIDTPEVGTVLLQRWST
jgi:hypothetical protein